MKKIILVYFMDDRGKNLLRKVSFDSTGKEKDAFYQLSHGNKDYPTALNNTFSSLPFKKF